jgi:hypothetical protein
MSLHFTSRHYTSPHITTLHLTSLHFTSHHYTSPHITTLHLTSLHFTSLHFTSLHFTQFPSHFYSFHFTHLYLLPNSFLKIFGSQLKVPNAVADSWFQLKHNTNPLYAVWIIPVLRVMHLILQDKVHLVVYIINIIETKFSFLAPSCSRTFISFQSCRTANQREEGKYIFYLSCISPHDISRIIFRTSELLGLPARSSDRDS